MSPLLGEHDSLRSALNPEPRNPFLTLAQHGAQREAQVSIQMQTPHSNVPQYRVLIRSGLPPHHMTYSFETPRDVVIGHVLDIHRPAVERALYEGRELLLEWRGVAPDLWRATTREVQPGQETPEPPVDAELVRRLRRELRTAKRERDTIREQTLNLQRQHEEHSRLLIEKDALLESLATLQRTAVIWRDSRNGSRAKLVAFKDFCEALDSLPVPQDA